ncbi:MAG TPA: hypothetical protein DDW52_01005 [Planctomycetaceae bacterium]|nr:hypothetical protein [Planctomycetaceae bacterium]
MCGRYTLKTNPETWAQLLLPLTAPERTLQVPSWTPRYNIAPTQTVLALRSSESEIDGENPAGVSLGSFRWGLLPFWAKDTSIGNRMINARGETLTEKRSFAKAFESRRCLLLADGYYEWQKTEGGKVPTWIYPADKGLMLMAGLWEKNTRVAEQPIESCTIITTQANPRLAPIHDRMPVMIDPVDADLWLNPHNKSADVVDLLQSASEDALDFHGVSKLVNSPKNDSPECLEKQQWLF